MVRRSPFFLRIIPLRCPLLLLTVSRHDRRVDVQCEIIKSEIIEYPPVKILAHPHVFCLRELREKPLVNILPRRPFPSKYLPQCRIVPRYLSVQKSIRSAPYARYETLDYRAFPIPSIRSRLRQI